MWIGRRLTRSLKPVPGSRPWPLVDPDQLSHRQDVPSHGSVDVGLAHARGQSQSRVQRVHPEEVAVRPSVLGRARTEVAYAASAHPLYGAAGDPLVGGNALRQRASIRWQIEEHPVHEPARVGVVRSVIDSSICVAVR